MGVRKYLRGTYMDSGANMNRILIWMTWHDNKETIFINLSLYKCIIIGQFSWLVIKMFLKSLNQSNSNWKRCYVSMGIACWDIVWSDIWRKVIQIFPVYSDAVKEHVWPHCGCKCVLKGTAKENTESSGKALWIMA